MKAGTNGITLKTRAHTTSKASKKRGFFISFEGGEGAGKSTQLRLLMKWLREQGQRSIYTLEPGGTPIGEKIRELLLNPGSHRLSPRAELFLYQADRAQHVEELILPELERGTIVLCDRYGDSSTVYQGLCRGMGTSWAKELNRFSTNKLTPDLTFLLDVPEQEGLRRVRRRLDDDVNLRGAGRRVKLDRIEREKLDFHRRVRTGFLRLAKEEARRIHTIDASLPLEDISEQIREVTFRGLKRRGLWKNN